MAYDSPNRLARREIQPGILTGAASAVVAKFHQFQKATLKAVHGTVQTAGTNAAAGLDIYVGTTSVGAITFGTNTAGSTATSGAINAAVPANSVIELRGKANSATLQFTPSIEVEISDEAAVTQ